MAAGLAAVGMGAVVLSGWICSVEILEPLGIAMKFNAALGLILTGASLLLVRRPPHLTAQRIGIACAVAAATIGSVTLCEHLFLWNAGIDQLFVRELPGALATASPGRMGPPAATCFLLGGISLLLLHVRRAPRLAQALAAAVVFIALLAIVGYAYGATELFRIAAYTGIALHTALTLFALGLGLLAVRFDEGIMAPLSSDLPGGIIARRVLPAVVIVPLLLGAVRLYGQRAGYFDLGFGTAVFALAIVAILTAFVWQSAAMLNRAAGQRDAAQAALLREREELADFVENATVGLHWVDAAGTILWTNQEELNMLGYAREEYVGRNIVDFHADPDVITNILKRLRSGESVRQYEARLRCRNGEIRHVQISSSVRWEEGRFVHTRCFTRDVTERRKAQEAALEARRQLSMALVAARMGTWSWDVATGALEWSDNLAEIHGLEQGTFGGTYQAFLACVHPDDRERVDSGVRRAVAERSTYDVEFRVPFPDGSTHWVAGHGQVFVDSEGNPVRMIGIGQDVTARRKGEESLASAYAQAQGRWVRDTFLSVAGMSFVPPSGL